LIAKKKAIKTSSEKERASLLYFFRNRQAKETRQKTRLAKKKGSVLLKKIIKLYHLTSDCKGYNLIYLDWFIFIIFLGENYMKTINNYWENLKI